eukprot:CAMPEP_0172404278 /NCGR_PEP_ID=MMETSP1061-20121228/62493_1 /TAXON_ID=37318 /ORGANISM="Pseudo-nitzschia pungens, Strain cf. pungens" /LENGTH=233 /DNA_ID=CAMNT_0013138993 /DNA_START=59 /DNA_END=760 /DNA_ORIENTATION=-
MKTIVSLLLLVGLAAQVRSFTVTGSRCLSPMAGKTLQHFPLSAEASEASPSEADSEEEDARPKLDTFLEKKYPDFYNLINEDMMKAMKQGAVTVFVPNAAAFEGLGDKKRSQLDDPRNLEIREKIGSYHVIAGESIDAMTLRTEDWSKGRPKDGSKPNTMIAGFKTLSGEVPVGRSKSGGFLGFGAKEDGDIVIGPEAKIVQSYNVEGSFIHEVTDLISPLLLWRYCDQLRIL